MFGIVTTGQRWQFVRWSESLDELPVYISDEHICNFTDDFKIEIKVVKYIAQILQTQVQHFIIMIMIMKTTSILQNINVLVKKMINERIFIRYVFLPRSFSHALSFFTSILRALLIFV